MSVISKEVFVKPKDIARNNGAGRYTESDFKSQTYLTEPQGKIKTCQITQGSQKRQLSEKDAGKRSPSTEDGSLFSMKVANSVLWTIRVRMRWGLSVGVESETVLLCVQFTATHTIRKQGSVKPTRASASGPIR